MFYYLMLMCLFLYQCSHQIKFISSFMEERTHESLHSFSLSVCVCVCVCVCSVMSDAATPWTVSCSIHCPLSSPGQSTGVGCHFLLQGLFPTAMERVALVSPALASLPAWLLSLCATRVRKNGADICSNLVGPSEHHTS